MLWLASKVGPKGQAVIPKPVRDQLGIHSGDRVLMAVEGDHIVIRPDVPKRKDWLDEFRGAFPKRRLPPEVDWDDLYGSRGR